MRPPGISINGFAMALRVPTTRINAIVNVEEKRPRLGFAAEIAEAYIILTSAPLTRRFHPKWSIRATNAQAVMPTRTAPMNHRKRSGFG